MRKKKKHRIIKWMLFVLIALLVVGGVVFYLKKNSNHSVDVYAVEELKVEGLMENTSFNGMITDHASQEIAKDEDKKVKEIYVKDGQKVKKGDPLLVYDMTMKELELDDAKINLKLEEEKIKRIKRQLKNPKKYILNDAGGVLDLLEDSSDDSDDSDDELETESLDSQSEELETEAKDVVQENAEETSKEVPKEENTLSTMDGQPGGIEVPENFDGKAGDNSGIKVTKEEIHDYVETKQMELKQAELSLQKKKLAVSKLEKEVKKNVVHSFLEGVVTMGDDEDEEVVLRVDNTKGLYIKGAMNEYLIPQVKEGTVLKGMDYYSGESFEAVIQSVSDTPQTNAMYYYDYSLGNQLSYYGFTAEIQGKVEAESGDDCELTLEKGEEEGCISLEKMFVLQENGASYVYKENKDGKLEKTKVHVGSIVDGYYVKVLKGLKESDYVAFPYGRNVKNGVPVTHAGIDSLYQ